MANENPVPDENTAPENAEHQAGNQEPAPAGVPPAEPPAPPVENNKKWYVVKVQSAREESIKAAIERRVKIEGLQEFFGEIVVPAEKYTEVVKGKRVVKERKLYPGYLMVNLEYNDRMLYLFRETSGVGDFVGGSLTKPPQPMTADEIERMQRRRGQETETGGRDVPAKPKFDKGDRVKVKDGTFAGMEGEVKEIVEAKGMVRVELTIFGRPVPVELEYWQVDDV